MQTISRKNLQAIYNNVCTGWQKRIKGELDKQLFSDTLEVSDTILNEALSSADDDQKKMLKKYFTFPQDASEKINSIEDVYSILGVERKLPYPNPTTKFERHLNSSYDIPHITAAYNGGTVLDWTNENQNKYYIWWKKNASGRWVVYVVDCCYCHADLGFGSYFAKREHAVDASKKFEGVYIDYLPE